METTNNTVQEKTRLEFYNLLISKGFKCEIINDGGCRLDIHIDLYPEDKSKLNRIQKNFTNGVLGVFWNGEGFNHKVQYLGHRINGFDGYEVRGGWVDVDLNTVVNVIENDIKSLKEHFSKKLA